MLGLPCNKPPPVPQPKCGETLECLGMSAQCFSGYGAWSHAEPVPGGAQCIECFMQRVRDQSGDYRQKESRQMIQNNCPYADHHALSNFLECFCYEGDNVFAPWPSTTTTTPAPKPLPPVPHPYTTPAPKPIQPCDVPPTCWTALNNVKSGPKRDLQKCVDKDPFDCGECVWRNWGPGKALAAAGCPGADEKVGLHPFDSWNYSTIGLCLCGPLHPSATSCPAKVSGICNMYHKSVTFNFGRERIPHFQGVAQCTAAAGGRCQLGGAGADLGVPVPECETNPGANASDGSRPIAKCSSDYLGRVYPVVLRSIDDLPRITSEDGQVDIRLWLDLSMSTLNGIDRKSGTSTNFTHACGYKQQWSVVIDESGKMSVVESEHGLDCPNQFEPVNLVV